MRDELTSRERRRRRRMRNQILAYIVMLVIVALIITGGYFGVRAVITYFKNYNDKVSEALEDAEANAASQIENESEDNTQEQGDTEQTQEDISQNETETDPIDELVESLLNDMTLEQMVAGMFIVSPESLTGVGKAIRAGDSTKNAINQNPVGGLIYSASNYQSEEQFVQMLANTMGYSEFPLFLAVSKECGQGTEFGVGATASAAELTDTDSVHEAYSVIAQKLVSYGVNMNLAPVAEISSEDGDASLRGRTFGSDAGVAAPLVNAAVQAMQEQEVSAVLQKFPGGSAEAKSLEELNNSEFLVYNMAIQNGVDCIMVSHVSASGVTGEDVPCSLSAGMITDVLRNGLGFDGVVITDKLNDKAVTSGYSSAEAAVAAVLAGADVLLEPQNYQEAYEGVLQAVEDGIITQERIHESLYRIYRVKYKHVLE